MRWILDQDDLDYASMMGRLQELRPVTHAVYVRRRDGAFDVLVEVDEATGRPVPPPQLEERVVPAPTLAEARAPRFHTGGPIPLDPVLVGISCLHISDEEAERMGVVPGNVDLAELLADVPYRPVERPRLRVVPKLPH